MSALPRIHRPQWAWAIYDAANSAYALCILAGLYPILFVGYWGDGLTEAQATSYQTFSVSAAGFVLAIAAPFLGALAENWGGRKRLLAVATLTGATATALYALPGKGDWPLVIPVYVLATFSFYSAILFYDSLLPTVAKPEERHRLSGIGYACGYFGSVLLFIVLTIGMISNHEVFGFGSASEATRVGFLIVGLWWFILALPLFLIVKEPDRPKTPIAQAIHASFAGLKATALQIWRTPRIFWFLLAYWFYIDGVHTLITTATGFGKSMGLDDQSLLLALIVVQVTGIFSAFGMGLAGAKFGPRKVIGVMLVLYIAVAVIASRLTTEPWDFLLFQMPPVYLMALLIGIAQGGVQVLSRSYYSNLVPPDQAAAFFGFYNMLGRSAAVVGPLLAGAVTLVSGDPRTGIVSVGGLFIIGLGLLLYTYRHDRPAPEPGS